MNYGGSMPDWHQYNASQTNEVTPPTQNANSGHLGFIPGVSPPTLNAIGLNTEGLNKHQNDANFNPRNYQSFNNGTSGSNIPNNSPLASMVQMQNCIGHYGSANTRNPMVDSINTSVDPRNTTVGTINDEIGYRSNQVSFNGPIGHLNGPGYNLNATTGPANRPGPVPGPRNNSGSGLGSNSGNGTGPGSIFGPAPRHGPTAVPGSGSGPGNMGPRNTNIGSVPPPGKPAAHPSFIPCKGLCCNSDPNVNYQQWDKYGSYQNNASYRDNVHPSGYQVENRHYGNNCNFRKDNLEGKEAMGSALPNASGVDHRRNFPDYKYHKDHLAHRNYSASSGMFHNYPMQNYNYSTEHQKYPYPAKEHTKTNNMNMANNQGLLKHQESNFLAQQKYSNKQYQYQNGSMLPKGVTLPTLNANANMASTPQNPYFNSQFPRSIPTEMSHECQEPADNNAMVNRMQSSFMHNSSTQHQMYQHKIAMQKFSMENHLRELSRIPGYQSHPKYKECVLRYREVLKLQQTAGYQNPVQQAPRVATPVNAGVPPINLQFDQNGMLINSSYIPDGFPKLPHAPSIEQSAESIDKPNKSQTIALSNENCQQSQQSEQLIIQQQNEHVPSSCAQAFQKQNQFPMHKDYNRNQLKVQTSESHSFDTLSADTSNETLMQQKASKEFTNKPVLDVRQFLANWDETDDEEGPTADLPDTVLSETTPVVVVSYENVDLSSRTPQSAEASRRPSFCSSETLDSGKKDGANVIAAEDCLTISYSSPDNVELAKTSKRTIREGVVKPGSIIHCISNGPDEIPTIHIVDNLEISNILGASNDQVIQTLEKQKTISFFGGTSGNEADGMSLESTEQQEKHETRELSAHYSTPLNDANKNNVIEVPSISGTTQATSDLTATRKSNLNAADNMELKKQHSFEESHNPDDISLPDLPTSECTPISTTLNTPIHSDTEESSQNMEDLSISTNPIEVMQNSPVISFTQLNSEEETKNRSRGNLTLEFQKDNRYKGDEAHSSHEQDVSVSNFDFTSSSKAKSTEMPKNKQVKSLGNGSARRKVFLDGKESDTSLISMEYELDSRQGGVEGERNQERRSPGSRQERRRKGISTNANSTPTESDDEIHNLRSERERFRKKRTKALTISASTTNSEIDLTTRKKVKESTTWEDKCIDKYFAQKRDIDHLRQSKNSDPSFSQGGDHSVCHMTSQYKHYSVAVIKDNINLSDKRSQGTTDPSKTNCSNTKESSEELKTRKQVSGKSVSSLLESIQSQTSRLLQKDLKTIDGDVRYTAEEIRMLKEYRKKKDKQQSNETKSRSHSLKSMEQELQKVNDNSLHNRNKQECPQNEQGNEIIAAHKACLEPNSIVSLNSENLETQEDARGHSYSKSLIKNTDFGIQVANVNLKIKDSDVGKELIRGEKGKDHKEGIKIEINVSCTDRTPKGQEQNKRLLYDDRSLYEIEESLFYSNTLDGQRRLYCKENPEDNPKFSEKSIVTADAKDDTEMNPSATLKKCGRASLESNEETSSNVPKETCNSFIKSSRNSVSSKDTGKPEVIEATNFPTDHADIIKTKSAISNTAIVDANNKVKADREDSVQKQCSTSLNEEVASASHSKISKKLPESKLVELSTKSLNSLRNLDFNFEKLEYKKNSVLNLERGHRVDDESEDNGYAGKWKKPKIDIFEDCDMFQNSSGYVNPIFSTIDKLEDLHTVPVYTTKDGKISYSPNSRFTYHELMMEARKHEACSSGRKSHNVNTWNSYYNSKFRKLYKKKRHHGLSERKKNEYKDTKYLYDRKRNYSDEFCSKSHVKYKDYVHSIRNNNAVWSDHCNKIDKMYSSSDSDDEIADRSKNRASEVNSFKKSQVVEHKTVAASKLDRNEIAIVESDREEGNKGGDIADISLKEGKDVNLEETQSILSEIVEVNKDSEDRENGNDDCTDLLNSHVQSDIVPSNNENDNFEYIVGESSMLDNLRIISDTPKIDEIENNECINLVIDKVEDTIVTVNVGGGASTTDELLHSDLLNEEPLLNEEDHQEEDNNEQSFSGETKIIEVEEENHTMVSDNLTSSPIAENDSVNIEQRETCTNVEPVKQSVPETEDTKKVSEPQENVESNTKQVLQESSEPEISNNVTAEIIEEFEENIDLPEENILVCQEDIQVAEKIEISNEEKNDEENTKEENEEAIENLQHKNEDSSADENFLKKNSEEPESQLASSDETINPNNNSEQILIESMGHDENTNVSSDEVGTEGQNFPGFSKDEILCNANDNIAKNAVASVKDELEGVPSDVEKITKESELITDNLKEESSPDNLPNMFDQKKNFSRDSSVEKEMPALNKYCSIQHSPIDNVEVMKNEQKEKDNNCLEQVPCKSLSPSSNMNADLKTVLKLIIKKSDAPKSKSECSVDCTDSSENVYDAKLLSDVRPKIPKMIIVKNRSRSVTPTVEILEKNKSLLSEQNDESMDVDNSDFESYTRKYNCANRVPKVKIKLEDISSKDLKLYLKRKAAKNNIPSTKIKKSKTQENRKFEMDSSGTEEHSDEEDRNFQESMTSDTEIERIPKLKLKRHEESRSSSSDRSRGRDSSNSKSASKKNKRTKEENSKHSSWYDNNTAISDEFKKKYPQCIIEKIPKVIIKRTQIGAEFKCEISKRKKSAVAETSKWQPKVKLQRLQLLDHMVKDLKQPKIVLKNIVASPTHVKDAVDNIKNEDPIHDVKLKLSRSNSASNLSPVKCKQRRLYSRSDTDDTKVGSASGTEFDSNFRADRIANSETKNMKNVSRKLFSENDEVDRYQNGESDNEMVKHSFRNILLNKDNGSMVVKEEYLSFGTKEDGPIIEDSILDTATRAHSYGDNDNSIIKVDTSDESQTTIEILPASPDSSEDEAIQTTKNSEFVNNDRINGGDAIPTQLELELEVIDNSNIHSAMAVSKTNNYASYSKSKFSTEGSVKAYFSGFQCTSRNKFNQNDYSSLKNQKSQYFEKKSKDYIYCNDLLVKEVLAAKEALKKCLTRSENDDEDSRKSTPKRLTERKQGSTFSVKDLGKSLGNSENLPSNNDNDKLKMHRKSKSSERKEDVKETSLKQEEVYSMDCPTASTFGESSVPEQTTISLKASKKFGQASTNTGANNLNLPCKNSSDELREEKSDKPISKSGEDQKDNDNSNETKTKEDNMPLLVPEFALNFDSSSDRDSSRSPPVITNQEENAKIMEGKELSPTGEVEENKKHSYKDCEMTIADIITQLAYHEKATIKHKRYCNLCERWFPTTIRHRRHLAGYQHRYMEVTQRKSIHALFILFTGKPCPRLLPANVIRSDCSIGELTPLQIAVQDIAKCVEYTQHNLKTKE